MRCKIAKSLQRETFYAWESCKKSFVDFIERNSSESVSIIRAQLALTYFFDDENLIHDEIDGIRYVDDMIVMDYAMKLLQTT